MNKPTRKPFLIEGSIFTDHRGKLTFVNDFSLENSKRFYTITQSPTQSERAWQGHKTESKYFYCLNGAFAIRLVKIDDWENPDPKPEIESFKLTASKSEVLLIPGGYANGLKALKENSQLLIFSEFSVDEAKGDEQRFDAQKWINWEKV